LLVKTLARRGTSRIQRKSIRQRGAGNPGTKPATTLILLVFPNGKSADVYVASRADVRVEYVDSRGLIGAPVSIESFVADGIKRVHVLGIYPDIKGLTCDAGGMYITMTIIANRDQYKNDIDISNIGHFCELRGKDPRDGPEREFKENESIAFADDSRDPIASDPILSEMAAVRLATPAERAVFMDDYIEKRRVAANEPRVAEILDQNTKSESGDVAAWTTATANPCHSTWLIQKSGTCYFNAALNGMLVGAYSRSILASIVNKYVGIMKLRADNGRDDEQLRDFFKPFPWDACKAEMGNWGVMRALHSLLCVSKGAVGTPLARVTIGAAGSDPTSRNNASVQMIMGMKMRETRRKLERPVAVSAARDKWFGALQDIGIDADVKAAEGGDSDASTIIPILQSLGLRSRVDFDMVLSTNFARYRPKIPTDPPMMLIVLNNTKKTQSDNVRTPSTKSKSSKAAQGNREAGAVIVDLLGHMDMPRARTVSNCVYHLDHAAVSMLLKGTPDSGHAITLVYCGTRMHIVDSNLTHFVPVTLADVSIVDQPIRPLVNAYYEVLSAMPGVTGKPLTETEKASLRHEMHDAWGTLVGIPYAVYVRPDKVRLLEVQCPALTPPGGVPR
jgi:hypothetical protein